MPVGLTASDLYSGDYILTESLVVEGGSRHILPHTIFSTGAGVNVISYGIINTYTGGAWNNGSLLYKYRIEQA
jgi:hypothetical protein